MKCPKCGYLGFEPVDRCRNCGYDFSLAQLRPLELPIRNESAEIRPLEDLALIERATPADNRKRFAGEVDAESNRSLGAGARASAPVSPDALASFVPELPLFGGPMTDDTPLITKASPPRQPLAVRRATPEVPRVKTEPLRSQTLDLDLVPSATDRRPAIVGREDVEAGRRLRTADSALTIDSAALAARFVAVAIDLLILLVVDIVVVYFTMEICGLTIQDAGILPKGPLIAFLLVQNGGYLVAFTAGGQTLGKMAAGIRVVPSDEGSHLDLGRAAVRTIVWFLMAVPAGLGFLTVFFSRDHRGLHDRVAGTRVVRVS